MREARSKHCGERVPFAAPSELVQARYAAGTREILECWFEGRPIRSEYLIVEGGKLAGTGAKSYGVGSSHSQEVGRLVSAEV
jgi:formate dehydrogenase